MSTITTYNLYDNRPLLTRIVRNVPILTTRLTNTNRTSKLNRQRPTRRTRQNRALLKRLNVSNFRLLFRLATNTINTTSNRRNITRTTSRPLDELIRILFPLIYRGTSRLTRGNITLPHKGLLYTISKRRHRHDTTITINPLVRFHTRFHLMMTTIRRPHRGIIIRIITTRLPLPQNRPVFKRIVTYRENHRLRLPRLTINRSATTRRAIRLATTRLMIRRRTIILPTTINILIRLHRTRVLGCEPQAFSRLPRILLDPFVFRTFFPVLCAKSSFPILYLFAIRPIFVTDMSL